MQHDPARATIPDKIIPGISHRRRPPVRRRSSAERETVPTPRRSPEEPRAETPHLPRRLGRYTLFDHIGRGGMADIFLAQAATDFGGSRLVVIKEVLSPLAGSADFAEMLVSEAKLAARLCHANVVQVEDLGREDGALFIAMEYVEGLDLRELLRRCAKGKVALPVEFSLRIVIEALKGLSYAHRAKGDNGGYLGIVHRDVSPSNVLLSFEGEVKLCDFGIARANTLAISLTEETIVGKAGYMSPEQARGESLDVRADVFAVGIILWEVLAGRRLYKASPGEALLDVARRGHIPPLPALGLHDEEVLHAIVERALAADRDARYDSAFEMLQDLEEYAASVRMVASQIRFGEWLKDHFGAEVLATRRARALVVRALTLGPAAVIEPILRESRPTVLENDLTPSAFPVAARSDLIVPEPPSAAVDSEHVEVAEGRMAICPPEPAVRVVAPRRAESAEARAIACALAAAAVLFALWFFVTS